MQPAQVSVDCEGRMKLKRIARGLLAVRDGKALMRSDYSESVRPGRVAGARIAVLKSVKDHT